MAIPTSCLVLVKTCYSRYPSPRASPLKTTKSSVDSSNRYLTALKTQRRAVTFNQGEGVIDSMKQGNWTQHAWEPGLLDRFSQQQQLRLTLMAAETPPEQLVFMVVDGPKISEKVWQRVAADPIQTPLPRLTRGRKLSRSP